MKILIKEKKDLADVLLPMLRQRWSPRAFADREVSDEILHRLFEAARWSPSSANEQPWHFVYAKRQDAAEFETLLSCLVPGNHRWVKDAQVIVLTIASTIFEKNQKTNPHAWHDVGQAAAHLSIQAMAEGIYVHQMAGYDAEKTKQTFHIEGNFEPVTFWAMGYLGEVETLMEDLREREMKPQQRKPQEEFVFKGKWK